MYRRANANGLLVRCDYQCRTLRVATDVPLVPGFRPQLRPLATFTTSRAWDESEHAKHVTNDDVLQEIAWFWHDLEMNEVAGATA